MPSYQEIVAAARAVVSEIEPHAVEQMSTRAVLIDVREAEEFAQGTLPSAIHIPRGTLESGIGSLVTDPTTEIVVFCGVGDRSVLAARSLGEMGYTSVSSMAGGFTRWRQEGRGAADPDSLTLDQRTRYSRHLLLPEVGEVGQKALLDASVLLLGAGGLGSPAALYLAAAGVGTLGIVDSDVVDASNLQRQVLHNFDRIGMAKVESARETLAALNPDVKLVTSAERLTAANALETLAGYDIIIDGGDNFPTRYLLNDASLHLRIPVVHGSIFRFEGQVSLFNPYEGPCYRCLFPAPPPAALAPSCAEAGVLGVLPGVIGTLQATEAIKAILGIGTSLQGRLLIYDALDEEFSTVKLSRSADCPACAEPDRPPKLVDYDEACTPAGTTVR